MFFIGWYFLRAWIFTLLQIAQPLNKTGNAFEIRRQGDAFRWRSGTIVCEMPATRSNSSRVSPWLNRCAVMH
jgi:hypothetical protein